MSQRPYRNRPFGRCNDALVGIICETLDEVRKSERGEGDFPLDDWTSSEEEEDGGRVRGQRGQRGQRGRGRRGSSCRRCAVFQGVRDDCQDDDTEPPSQLPDGNTVQLPELFFRGPRQGIPFTPNIDWKFVGRDPTAPGPWRLAPRMYLVGSRIFIVDRTTAGERHPCIDLLRCEQSVESGCRAFAYKFASVIFTYGQHTHE